MLYLLQAWLEAHEETIFNVLDSDSSGEAGNLLNGHACTVVKIRGPEDSRNIRILHSGSKAQDP